METPKNVLRVTSQGVTIDLRQEVEIKKNIIFSLNAAKTVSGLVTHQDNASLIL